MNTVKNSVLLWGSHAQKRGQFIDRNRHYVLTLHPSPLSAHRGFLGCHHFSKTNEYLKQHGLTEIDCKFKIVIQHQAGDSFPAFLPFLLSSLFEKITQFLTALFC